MEPSFDTWTSLFLIVSGFGFFLFALLFFNGSNRKNNAPIALVVLAFSIILLTYVLYWTRYISFVPFLMLLPPACYLAIGPLLYIYFRGLFYQEHPPKIYWHFIPTILAFLVFGFNFLARWFGMDADTFSYFTPLFYINHHWIISAQMLVYAFLLWQMIGQHQKDVDSSASAYVRFQWAQLLFRCHVLFIAAYVTYYVLINFPFFNQAWDYAISMTMSLAIYSIGYMAFRQPAIFNGEIYASLFMPAPTTSEAPIIDASLDVFYKRLIHHLDQEKPYLDNELRLVHLADQLGYSVHLLSQIINQKSGKNFNQLINEYRLDAAADLLLNDPTLSIKSIYFEVGFNNKATFYNSFKKKFNCTPSEFRNRRLMTKSV